MKLAMRLGRTLEELTQSMSAQEFGLWLALYSRDPWDDTRGDYRAGLVCSTLANWSGRMLREGAKPLSPTEFMPFLQQHDDTPEVESDPMAHFTEMTRKP